jgi:hypothetical protein
VTDWAELAAKLQVTPATARRYARQAVTLPDGRQVLGGTPGTSAATIEEHRLRDALAREVHGITEAVLPYGRADVLTASAVYEVEPYRTWRHGARQVLAYSAQCGLPPALALFGAIRRDEMLRFYLKFREREPVIRLWWWTGYGWKRITARVHCTAMRSPS